jgi:competence protein ComEC
LPWTVSWLAALLYAALSGFGVSTQRALIMLTVGMVVVLSRRTIHPLQAWLIAMSLVLMADPFAPLRAGFWFSFIAVGVLMFLFVPRFGPMKAWHRMLLAQLGISLLMAPLGMYWFQQASLPGLLANLLAIPVVSILIVPAILLGLIIMWIPGPLAGWVFGFAGHSAHWLLQFLDFISVLQPVSFGATRTPGLATTALAVLGAAILLLPRPIPGRLAGVLLMLPLLLPVGSSPARSETQIDFLDVGQGLSVMLSTHDYLLIYDTGPGNGLRDESGRDMVAGTIEPMIKAAGRNPDLIIVSHADLDHAGGLRKLQSIFPDAHYLASLPVKRAGIHPCHTPGKWKAGKLDFRILHPSGSLPYLGNDSSCVVSVKGAGLSLLLSGDISHGVEKRLVDEGIGQHRVLTVPHHGSSTSSSQNFIDAVEPKWALISAATGNRFGFPRKDVLERYAKARVVALNTADCGGIRFKAHESGGYTMLYARVSRPAIWRWPASPDCRKISNRIP